MDHDNDRRISEHVLRMHRYRNPGEQDGEGKCLSRDVLAGFDPSGPLLAAMPLGGGVDTLATGGIDDDDERDQVETPVFDKHDRLLHGEVRR